MCDCITNGSYGYSVSSSGGGTVTINNCQPAIPPMIYISNGNALNTFYGLSASNLYSVNSYTGNLYVSGYIFGNLVTPFINTTVSNATIFQGGSFFGNGYGISNLNAANLSGSANLSTLTASAIFFNNAILATNLPISNAYQGIWGSFSNIPQISVDQYGRIGGVSNIRVVSSQWTTIDGNVAYGNGVSIGTLFDPPYGSNLYVVGTANIDTLNVTTLFANSATVFGPQTLNVLGTSNLNVVSAQAYYGNSSGLSNLNASNLAFGVVSSALIYGNTLSNIQVSNVSGYVTGNVLSNLNASNLAFGLINTALIYGNTLSNIQVSNVSGYVTGNVLSNLNASNLAFGLINTALIYGNTLSNIQVSNITGIVSGNVLSNLNASNLAFGVVNSTLIYGNTVSNLQFSNVVGFFSNALGNLNASNLTYGLVNTALIYANTLSNIQVSNITGIVSGNVLSNLNASNLAFGVVNSSLIYGNTLSNINGSNVSTVPTAQAVTVAAQPVITSVGTLTSLTVAGTTSSGTFSGSGSGLTGVPGTSITGTVQSATVAQVVSQAAQPNITSVGTLTSLSVTGTVSGGTFSGSGSSLTNIQASAIAGTVLTAQSVVTAAQPNITSVGTLTGLNVQGLLLASNGAGISNINAANVSLGTLTTSVFPASGATAGTYGSSANVSQVTVDQYGRVTSVSNVGFTAISQWTNINSNIAYGNGVSIGTLSNPPNGSNLYVLGTATITNVAGNGASISSLNSSNLVGNVASANVALVVSQGAQPNITSVGVLSNLVVANSLTTTNVFLTGNLNVQGVSNLTNVTTSNFVGVNGYYTGTLGIGASGAKLSVLGNVYASNAVQAPSVYATAATIGTVTTATVIAPTSFPLSTEVGSYTWIYGTDGTFNLPASILGTGIIQSATSAIDITVGLQTWAFNSTGAATFPGTITADGGLLSNISPSSIIQPYPNLVVSNSLTTTNVIATRSNITTLNVNSLVASTANVTTLNVNSEFVTSLVAATANVTTLNVNSDTVTFLVAGNIYSANSLTTTNVSTRFANVANLITTYANITSLNVTSLVSTNDIFTGPVRVGRGANLVATDTVLGASVLLNDTGAYDTAIGYQSMQNAKPTVGYDTALGSNTLLNDTGPGYNVAIGAETMVNSAPSQGQDVAIGFSTMRNDRGPGYNIAIGTYSMQNSNPSGGNDVAVGYYAMYNDQGPGYNTALGGEAMQSANPSGGYDVAVGWQALQNDSGGYNTALGANAGQGITGGQYNTALGAGSGPFSSSLYNTTSIGANAQPTVSNVAVFPYGINVGINTGAPGSSLEIRGNLYVSNSLTTTNVVATLANLATLNVTSVENVTQLVAGKITASNLAVSSNISLGSGGNTYVQGNVVVSGNVYSSLGELGVGGSLFFSLGAPYTPGYFTGSIPGGGAQTNKIQMSAFTQQGTSTYIRTSANGCFQFNQTGVYTVASNFLTNYNNILGLGIGSNVIDYGTRTDQTYLYSIIPSTSQNPTGVLETQFYVASTSLYYYVDAFSVDSIILQPTASASGTWISIAPLGGIAAASQSITISTLGNTVTGQATNYGAQITDYYIGCSTGITVTLPLGATLTVGKQYIIKDESGTASASRITVAATSPNLIDGSSSAILNTNYSALTLYWTGARWSIV